MRLLLDTHAFLWWLSGNEALSSASRSAIAQARNQIFVSAASGWEITTKHRLGKLPGVAAVVGDLSSAVLDQGFIELPITLRHGQVAGSLPGPHRDPLDRILIAQSILENLTLVSKEEPFDAYGVDRIW